MEKNISIMIDFKLLKITQEKQDLRYFSEKLITCSTMVRKANILFRIISKGMRNKWSDHYATENP